MNSINYKTIKVDELEIFYREAGNKKNPAILLLHGFPSSSYMYRDLINNYLSHINLPFCYAVLIKRPRKMV